MDDVPYVPSRQIKAPALGMHQHCRASRPKSAVGQPTGSWGKIALCRAFSRRSLGLKNQGR